ncbi:MarR family winged helix-turn-helix transcriptional regulator [Chitinophaga sp. GbtcB8]|uniref:MarR family winged helix-turn-helix transcriptional regulator n=1 Tax=Chitinophaga sp. GbtcB8 TaxID=2824753 RepID=UPI001C2F472F|nr:MarR family winged helix-turn-helix transcriptional regulator [Chitinophaga sp. GbtcB8]
MKKELVNTLRDFNRFYTTVLGVVNNHILESDYSLTEARIIYEVNEQEGITARAIKEKLQIDEGYMSRMVAKLVKQGAVKKKQSKEDKRIFALALTAKGRQIAADINRQSDEQVKNLVKHLDLKEREQLAGLIMQVKQLLEKGNAEK